MSGKLRVHSIPASEWSSGPNGGAFGEWIQDALRCEERRLAGHELRDDQARYERLSQRIEEYALCHHLDHVDVIPSDTYLNLLELSDSLPASASPARARLFSSFFPPNQLADHLALLEGGVSTAEEKAFIESIRGMPGIVVTWTIGDGFEERGVVLHSNESPCAVDMERNGQQTVFTLPRVQSADELEAASDGSLPADEALIKALRSVRQCPDAIVNIGPFGNHDVAAALNELAYDDGPAFTCRLRYDDGSVSRPLRLACLRRRAWPEKAPLLRASLMSHRHLVMDAAVDLAWFRNAAVSTGQPHADIEQMCHEETMRLLREHGEPLTIEMHQTGFLPAVVGFYRGVMAVLETAPEGLLAVRTVLPKDSALEWT